MCLIGAFLFVSGCSHKIPQFLADNPNVVISNDGLNNTPAFKILRFDRASSESGFIEQCMSRETGGNVVQIGNIYSVTGQLAYRASSMHGSIPFQYGLSFDGGRGSYVFKEVRFNEGKLGGPLYATESVNSEEAYREMESLVGRIDECLVNN